MSDETESSSTPEEPDVRPVQPGEWCAVCATRIPEGSDTITLIGLGEVQEVCSIDCAEYILRMWRESLSGG